MNRFNLLLKFFLYLFRLEDFLDAGFEYTDHILVFKLLNSSKMSAEAQWRVISTLQRRYRGDCNIVHMTLHLISKEIQIVNQTQVKLIQNRKFKETVKVILTEPP